MKVHGTYQPLITVLITLRIMPLKGLIGVTPIISRVISPVISEPPSRGFKHPESPQSLRSQGSLQTLKVLGNALKALGHPS